MATIVRSRPAAVHRPAADWQPEDAAFWERTGAATARRNLVLSVLTGHIGMSVWSLWSVLVLFLGPQYHIDASGKFVLTAVPTACGALLRVPWTFAVARFGGRNWTVVSCVLFLVPTVLTGIVLRPGVHYGTLLAVSVVAGVGGANFSSSIANMNGFYPQRLKGWALGVTAGGGNLGVPAVQLVGLLVLATAGAAHPRVLLAVYLPLIVLAAAGAALGMDNLGSADRAGSARGALRAAARDRDCWLVSALYLGAFGSFIGFAFAFGQVLEVEFHRQFATPVQAACVTFVGPLLGSMTRPLGGMLADRRGGAVVTGWTFAGMSGSAAVVLVASERHSLPLFLGGFLLLFALSGLGSGATYKLIPELYRTRALRALAAGADPAATERTAKLGASALIGISGAVGSFGAVLVEAAFRQSFLDAHDGNPAYLAFLGYYGFCLLLVRRRYPGPRSRRRT